MQPGYRPKECPVKDIRTGACEAEEAVGTTRPTRHAIGRFINLGTSWIWLRRQVRICAHAPRERTQRSCWLERPSRRTG